MRPGRIGGSDGRARVAAYVLTLNEEEHIRHAVNSLSQLTEHILVLDSGSSDTTADEAGRAGAVVETRVFDSFGRQRNFAIERVIERFDPEWILTIDADERLSRGLVREVLERVSAPAAGEADAYLIPLAVRFEGRLLRFGGVSRTRLLRLYRPNAGRYESRSVNEHFAVAPGKQLGLLTSPIEHEDVTSWERHIAKHNRYSTLEAAERAAAIQGMRESVSATEALRSPHLRRRWLREHVWRALPAKPLLRFVQMYVVCGGFLDGSPGFDLALFQAWQELCTERKFREIVARSNPEGERLLGDAG